MDDIDIVPDVMRDPAFAPPQRRDTASSILSGTDGGQGGETCRICRSEGTSDEPLFYPCKCSGSIKFVHQECLMEWLAHSHKKHCELCKTPFRFTKLYDADMPQTLPWSVFIQQACLHVAMTLFSGLRAILVMSVWLILLPLMIRWAWRWMFWFADAGWAREQYIRRMQVADVASQADSQGSELVQEVSAGIQNALYDAYDKWFGSVDWKNTFMQSPAAANVTATATTIRNVTATTNILNATSYWPQADASVLSSWTYLSDLTPSAKVNRMILDVFEGQLITCVVILGFILLFLIREWVVLQQPLVNVDQLQNENREQDRRIQERDRLRRQAELLEEARLRLIALQNQAGTAQDNDTDAAIVVDWEEMYDTIDATTNELRPGGSGHEQFALKAAEVMRQILAAENAGTDAGALADKVYQKLSAFPTELREAWEDVLLAELEARGGRKQDEESSSVVNEIADLPDNPSAQRRPPMPTRATSSAATHIKRILEEADTDNVNIADLSSATASPPQPPSGTPSLVSAPSLVEGSPMEGSWVDCSPPNGGQPSNDTTISATATTTSDLSTAQVVEVPQPGREVMPITNAGPDAKINIKRKGNGKGRVVVPEPEEYSASRVISTAELKKRLSRKAGDFKDLDTPAQESSARRHSSPTTAATATLPNTTTPVQSASTNLFHPDGPEPTTPATIPAQHAEAGFPQAHIDAEEEQRQVARAELGHEAVLAEAQSDAVQPAQEQQPAAPVGLLDWIVNWFWGDIQLQNAPEPVPAAGEELVAVAEPVPLLLEQDEAPLAGNGDDDEQPPEVHDPEVVAAAQQAGLDAEAIEDAEDLEGIFELIGLQGPIIGLFQTSCFCSVLVIGSVFCAIGVPYMWGKLVLVFVSSPFESLIKAPLRFVSLLTDFLVDIALFAIGWMAASSAVLVQWLFSALETVVPLGNTDFTSWAYKLSKATAISAYHRLASMFPAGGDTAGDTGMQRAWLHISVEAHTSLKTVQHEVDAVLKYTGSVITSIVETVSSGSAQIVLKALVSTLRRAIETTTRVLANLETTKDFARSLWAALTGGQSSSHFASDSTSTVLFDPSLVYWDSNDRGLAVLAGYLALAMLAAIYVAADTPITSSPNSQKIEKIVRDSLRQAGGVMKVILIISIEMLVFPLYCGLLLDIAFLPLQEGASLATRWAFSIEAPYTFCFIHWFVGTCYMFHFALFVGMCRKILRKGVLWFIRDPDDPNFHPVRDVLERNVTTQLRKIAFSALVYGALVILCLGGVIWSIGKAFKDIFPIHWVATEPYVEFSVDLLLYTMLTPTLWSLVKPSKAVHTMYAWWLRRCARALRLSHFLFDDRKKDEEGQHVRHSWTSLLTLKSAKLDEGSMIVLVDNDEQPPEVTFERNGKYVLTPCNDQYRPPKPGEAFIHVEDDDVYIADKDGKKNDHFGKIYVPPHFRARMTLFMVGLWMFSAFIGLCATLVPLCFGRRVLSTFLPDGVVLNDIYAYSVGAYFFGSILFLVLKGGSGIKYARKKASSVDVNAWVKAAKKITLRTLRCLYVYGFVGLVMPFIFAMVLQFYFIMPLHTYLVASVRPALSEAAISGASNSTLGNSTVGAVVNATLNSLAQHGSNVTEPLGTPAKPSVAEHSVHVLADSALGMLVGRIVLRSIVTAPTSRAAEAFRRITADGYLNPNARIATRFCILPAILISSVLLLAPLGLGNLMISLVTWLGPQMVSNFEGVTEEVQILVMRYSYPVTAAWVASLWAAKQITKATSRWRARIRDEVYLVGERLHNFGEKKPPPGTREVRVVKKER
ncbi:Putative Zinc finger, RING-type [Septoria linicola]|uniref:RING-type E3 ubiquitin transferase n=1 Tax=Septoria linicola TaxID=215465 RepID=A0A9Q9AT58_9PEZI|nr:Putative Zinc finger, RING-type [Septoria linicola]